MNTLPLSRARMAALAASAALCTAPLAALAHTGADGGDHHNFLAGLLHPLTGADHLAAMVAVGLWSALAARRAWPDLLWAPLAFVAMLFGGAVLGLSGVVLPAVEPMIAASLLVLGLLVATRLRLPGLAAAALVGAFAVFHGVAHGHELAGDSGAAATLAGMLVATTLLHVAGMGAGWALRRYAARPAATWLPRMAGACVAAFGVTLLAQQLA